MFRDDMLSFLVKEQDFLESFVVCESPKVPTTLLGHNTRDSRAVQNLLLLCYYIVIG